MIELVGPKLEIAIIRILGIFDDHGENFCDDLFSAFGL